ncbi:helix-turn-helix domain-containing protein, partial [Streptomyces thinghirensis]|uniref:helix-turn-helix domain-containing protein n=1 Tax=Streptomyces thinghirensis TaxID=551547 RepID=UPI0031EDB212
MSELFDAVDALVASRSPLPPPAERRRLRQAHALTLDEVASALGVRRATVGGWESGKAEPRPPEREAYARLLKQLATLYPAPQGTGAPQGDTGTDAPAAQARLTGGGAAEATATAEAEGPPAAPPAPVRHAAAT